jgi:hypothetical protein
MRTRRRDRPGACNGFVQLAPDAPVARQCMHNMQEWLRRQLGAGR